MNLESSIINVILDRLTVPNASLRPETPLFTAAGGGLELDSLASLDILAGLSEKFGLPCDDIEAKDFQTVATLADYLRSHNVQG